MSLTKQDLVEHEKYLLNIIEHYQKELEAVRYLIKGYQSRVDAEKSINTDKSNGSSMTLREAIRQRAIEVKEFTAAEMTKHIIDSGLRDESDWRNLRSTISTLLRDMTEVKNELIRENVGTADQPVYRYRLKKNESLFQ